MKVLISLICVLSFFSTTFLSPLVHAKNAEAIALEYKTQANSDLQSLSDILTQAEKDLNTIKNKVVSDHEGDWSALPAWTTAAAAAVTIILMSYTLYSLKKGGDQAWGALAILPAGVALVVTSVTSVLDLWMSPDVNASELNKQVMKTLVQLQNLRSTLQGQQRGYIDLAISEVQNIDIEATAQEKKESSKKITMYVGWALAGAGAVNFALITQGVVGEKYVFLTGLASAGAAATMAVASVFTNEDRTEILQALDNAIRSVRQAKVALQIPVQP